MSGHHIPNSKNAFSNPALVQKKEDLSSLYTKASNEGTISSKFKLQTIFWLQHFFSQVQTSIN